MRGISFKHRVLLVLLFSWVLSCLAQTDDYVLYLNKNGRKLGLTGAPYGAYSSESGFGGGLQFILFDALPDSVCKTPFELQWDMSGTTGGERKLELDFTQRYQMYNLISHLEYKVKPSDFYGVGGDTPAEAMEDYESEKVKGKISLVRKMTEFLDLGPLVDFQYQHVSDRLENGILDIGMIKGSEDFHNTLGLGFLAEYKDLDQPSYPLNGYRIITENTIYKKGMLSDYSFFKSSVDIRYYRKILRKSVLAGQLIWQGCYGDVPFQQMPEQGGAYIMRGYKTARFLDEKMLAGQIEFRSPFYRRFAVVSFVGLANSFAEYSNIQKDHTHWAGGIGFRFNVSQSKMLNLRGDIGFTDEGKEIYFKVGEAF